MKELIPLFAFVSFLFATYTLVQVIKLNYKVKIPKKKNKHPTYHWSDGFGLLRGYLGLVYVWVFYLLGVIR